MNSFELEIDEKSRVGSEFMARVVNEIRRAVASEKASRKLTQQAIADKIGTSRAVINRQIQGLENLSARRIAEILWAIGWEPHFEARKTPEGDNSRPANIKIKPIVVAPPQSLTESKSEASGIQIRSAPDWVKIGSAAVTTQ
jgi:hypothetical protein